eukprot:15446192-Alexandrium_andersonii.AAC.1
MAPSIRKMSGTVRWLSICSVPPCSSRKAPTSTRGTRHSTTGPATDLGCVIGAIGAIGAIGVISGGVGVGVFEAERQCHQADEADSVPVSLAAAARRSHRALTARISGMIPRPPLLDAGAGVNSACKIPRSHGARSSCKWPPWIRGPWLRG